MVSVTIRLVALIVARPVSLVYTQWQSGGRGTVTDAAGQEGEAAGLRLKPHGKGRTLKCLGSGVP